jgi:hypothetical protein
LYGDRDPFLGIFTSSGSSSIDGVWSNWYRLFSILTKIYKRNLYHCTKMDHLQINTSARKTSTLGSLSLDGRGVG